MKRVKAAICTAAAALMLGGCSSTTNGSLLGGDSSSPAASTSAGFPATTPPDSSGSSSDAPISFGTGADDIAGAMGCTDVHDAGEATHVGGVTAAENVTCTLNDVPIGIITFSSATDTETAAQALKDSYKTNPTGHAVLQGDTWMIATDNDDLSTSKQHALLTDVQAKIGGELFTVGGGGASSSRSAGKGYNGEYPDTASLAAALHCKITQRFDPADVEQLQGTAPVEAAQCEGSEWTYVLEIWDSAETSNDALISWSTKIAKGRVDVITLGDVWWVRTTKHKGVEATEAELHADANTLKATLGGEIVNIPQ